jgi:Peptidase family S41
MIATMPIHRRAASSMRHVLGFVCCLTTLGLTTCRPEVRNSSLATAAALSKAQQVENLHAFARIYGLLRWFHPSDACAAIDWDLYAIAGVRRVAGARNRDELRTALLELVGPIAPTVQVKRAAESFTSQPARDPQPGFELVSWQHQGFGDSTIVSAFASKRRHRTRIVAAPGVPYGTVWQGVDATPLRGKRIRLRGKLRTARGARGQLWLRVERGDTRGFFDNMEDRPALCLDWCTAEIAGPVSPDATRIAFGTLMSGLGTVWYDDFDLSIQEDSGTWSSVPLRDPGFESSDPFVGWSPGIGTPALTSLEGWAPKRDFADPASGSASLRMQANTVVDATELFDIAPSRGEFVDVELGAGLRARVPLTLDSVNGHTQGDAPDTALAGQSVTAEAARGNFDPIKGIADTIVVWNVLEHFWPYWADVSVDWTATLDQIIDRALSEKSWRDHLATLRWLSAAAPDGHARVSCPGTLPSFPPPFQVDSVEGEVVVTASADASVLRGDVIVAIDGVPANSRITLDEAFISGSPQWRRLRALQEFGVGSVGTRLSLRVRRNGATIELAVTRRDPAPDEFARPAIERLPDGVYYVDLSRASIPDIQAAMGQIASASGVVFDVRKRPTHGEDILSHLLTIEGNRALGMSVPRIIRPNRVLSSVTSWETYIVPIPVLEPHIRGRVAFVTGAGAISYAESLLAVVEHYRLGAIVGSPTAGTNGNIAEISEPSGCRTTFTGLRVTKPNGARQHLLGIVPTISASRTIAGVTGGRDEVLERALKYVREPAH